jgi:hypothetical protein
MVVSENIHKFGVTFGEMFQIKYIVDISNIYIYNVMYQFSLQRS